MGVAGRGQENSAGVFRFSDPRIRSEDPTPSTSPSWEINNIPKILLELDPDDMFAYYLSLVTREREDLESAVARFVDLFDADACPEKMLPYLARAVGAQFLTNSTVAQKRQQIKQAISVYKRKGLLSAFDIFFNQIGIDVELRHVYAMPQTEYRRSLVLAAFNREGYDLELFRRGDTLTWVFRSGSGDPTYPPGYDEGLLLPSNYIDIVILSPSVNAGAAYFVRQDTDPGTVQSPALDYYAEEKNTRPANIADVDAYVRDLARRLEEIRPIHVLIRTFAVLISWIEQWPETLEDNTFGIQFDFHDDFLPNSGSFAKWNGSDTPTGDAPVGDPNRLKETNTRPQVSYDGTTAFLRQPITQHRIGFQLYYSSGYEQAYAWRPKWGPQEPHTTRETVPLLEDAWAWNCRNTQPSKIPNLGRLDQTKFVILRDQYVASGFGRALMNNLDNFNPMFDPVLQAISLSNIIQ
jgi:phage tail P2-like protein